MAILFRHQFEYCLLILLLSFTYLTYSPGDFGYFWMYWFTVFLLVAFGTLMDVLFCDDMSFLYDPNFSNWQRKTNMSL